MTQKIDKAVYQEMVLHDKANALLKRFFKHIDSHIQVSRENRVAPDIAQKAVLLSLAKSTAVVLYKLTMPGMRAKSLQEFVQITEEEIKALETQYDGQAR